MDDKERKEIERLQADTRRQLKTLSVKMYLWASLAMLIGLCALWTAEHEPTLLIRTLRLVCAAFVIVQAWEWMKEAIKWRSGPP